MATGRMSWQFHNQKHLPSYGLSGGSDGAGDMQDMHLKMSKKIAQLTKVIYALNTKNDEHEAAMLALKDAHEEEVQQMLTETAAKIQQYRLKIGNELDLRRKIKNLEECISTFEREKKQALIEIDADKHISAERAVEKEHAHEEKVRLLTREMVETKTAFEQRIHDFEEIVTNLEKEKHKNVDSVTSSYLQQVTDLRQQLQEQETNASQNTEKLIDSHNTQVQKFETEISDLKREIKKTIEDSEAKMDKAKAFYEHELTALRSSNISDQEMADKWLERETALKQETSRIELTLRNKVKGLSSELDIQHDEVTNLTQQLNQSKSEANGALDHIKDLRDQLGKLQQEYSAASDRIKFSEEELATANSRVEMQAADILRKSSIIGTLEAIKLTQQESIHDLESQMKNLKKRLQDLELAKIALETSQSDENSQLVQQLQIMGKRIENLSEEKSSLHKQFKHDLEEMKISHEDETETLKQQFEKEMDSMARTHQSEIDSMKNETREAMDKLLQEMQERILREAGQFEADKAAAIAKLEGENEAVNRTLKNAQNEVSRLSSLIEQHESGLGDASSHINALKSRISELENDVMTSDTRCRTSEATVVELRGELKQQGDSHLQLVSKLNTEHQVAVEKTVKDTDRKWEEEMSTKLAELRTRLNEQHEEDRRNALNDLEVMKNREMEASKAGWEEQIKLLSTQMSEMRNSIEMERRDFERKLEAGLSDMTEVERKLRHEAVQAENEYTMKINHLKESHEMALVAMEQRKEEELKSLEANLQSQHREGMHSQMRAQQIALEGVRDRLNREKQEEIERKEAEFEQDMDELRSELAHQQAASVEEMTRQYEGQLAAAKQELDQSQEVKQRNEERLNQKLFDLETDLRLSTSEANKLRDRVSEQNEMLSTLNKELDQKGQEILRIRSEANIELRHREEEMTRKFQSKQDQYEADFIRRKHGMVYEFNKATEALKDKLSSLHIALQEAEERYERRESRPEDLDSINQLKSLVRDREEQIQKLVDDKKYYQMELVNRETNFNKVFSSSPNVGVLNPRNKKSKGSNATSAPPRFSSQFVSVPNLSSIETAMNGSNRLEPLRAGSNSPSNYNKHLQPTPPQHPKKFLRTKSENPGEFSSSFVSMINSDAAPDNLHSDPSKFIKLRTERFVDDLLQLEPLSILEEKYDNVVPDGNIMSLSDLDILSHNATEALNSCTEEWKSECDLPSMFDETPLDGFNHRENGGKIPSYGSLPGYYSTPVHRKSSRRNIAGTLMSALKVKQK